MYKFKEKRLACGLTQAEVAEAAGITVRAYQYYENGDKAPSVDVAIKIAKKLDSTVEDVFSISY